ncbi:hypothetical protein BDD12DRAFT_802794 [Trichophaea hybrida]|nr:hypothetical protein BDD12DRAFT_802794 [Trichophaea hybrida]
MLYFAFATLGLLILAGCVEAAAAAPPPDVLDNLRYCTIHRQTEVEARERAQRPFDTRIAILNAAISDLTATLNQNGAAPLSCTFHIPYPDITDVIFGALDSQNTLDWCSEYLSNVTNSAVEFPRKGAIISNFVAGCSPRASFIEGMLLPSITFGAGSTLAAGGNFEIRGPSVNKTTNIFFANGTQTNIAAVQKGSVNIPNISGEVGVIGLSSSIFEDAAITSLMSVVRIKKIEDNPTINTPWRAIHVAAWAIFLGTTVIYMVILGALHCCDWLEERSRARVKAIIATIFVVSTITIFILCLLGTWPATLTQNKEDAWHFFGSFAIYIINGIWAFPAILRYRIGGRKLTNRWRQRRGRHVLRQVQIELQHQVAPAPAPAAIPPAVLDPPHHLVGNVAGSLNPNPPGDVATVPFLISAAQHAVFLAEGSEADGPQGRGLGSTEGLDLQDQERLKDSTYTETALLQTGMYGIFAIVTVVDVMRLL